MTEYKNKGLNLYDANGREAEEGDPDGDALLCGRHRVLYEQPTPTIDILQTGEDVARNSGGTYTYEYFLRDNLGNTRVVFTPPTGSYTATLVQHYDYYAFDKEIVRNGSSPNKYLYNGKALRAETGQYDYGARFYDPVIARWMVVDPKDDLLEMSSPYVFCYNNPIIYKDSDGELAILINGRATGDSQRGNASYWDNGIIEAIKSSGIPNSSNMMFVDGDRYYNHVLSHDFDRTGEESIKNGRYLEGNYPSERREAGYTIGKQEFQNILSKLAKDPATGKIIEKIQIYTHSRGAAFGADYIDALLEMIKQNADKFADPNSVIDLVYNMAPHQSNSIDELGGLNAYSQDHTWDPLSGNDMSGIKGAFSSNEGDSLLGQHATKSFVKDIPAFTKSFVANGNNSQQLINDFIKKMKADYGITVKQ